MLKHLTLSIIIVLMLLLGSCTSTGPTKTTISIKNTYRKLIFKPDTITTELSKNLILRVTPIDPKNLNPIFYSYSLLDGNYNNETSTKDISTYKIIFQNASEPQTGSKQTNENPKYQKVVDFIDQMNAGNKLPALPYKLLREEYLYGDTPAQVDEDRPSTDTSYYPNLFNPYFINDKYLSCFELEFYNKGSTPISIRSEQFKLNINKVAVPPLRTVYFESLNSGNPNKLWNAYRWNMPDSCVIMPGEKIIKYLAFPPINPFAEYATLYIDGVDKYKSFNWDLEFVSEEKTNKIDLYKVEIKSDFESYTDNQYFVILQGDKPIIDNGGIIYLDKEQVEKSTSIYVLGVSNYSFYYGKIENAKPFEFIENNNAIIEVPEIEKGRF